jgi:hypothetical protein
MSHETEDVNERTTLTPTIVDTTNCLKCEQIDQNNSNLYHSIEHLIKIRNLNCGRFGQVNKYIDRRQMIEIAGKCIQLNIFDQWTNDDKIIQKVSNTKYLLFVFIKLTNIYLYIFLGNK